MEGRREELGVDRQSEIPASAHSSKNNSLIKSIPLWLNPWSESKCMTMAKGNLLPGSGHLLLRGYTNKMHTRNPKIPSLGSGST